MSILKDTAVADRAAREILAAVDRLPAHLLFALAWNLAEDDEPTLMTIGEAIVSGNPDPLASEITFASFCGSATVLLGRLAADVEPWTTISRAVSDVRSAVYAEWPDLEEKQNRRRRRNERPIVDEDGE